MAKDWIIAPPWDGCTEAASRWGLPPLVAQLLHNRGLDVSSDPQDFLNPRMTDLHPPELLGGATQAATLLAKAVAKGRRIVIYGDYDVDGITGSAILWNLLRAANADVTYYVPHRLEEGYGLNAEAVRKLIEDGAQTLVTVDCGITAIEEAKLVAQLGAQLIVTDHHTPGDQFPDAAAVVHPAIDDPYPNQDICGAGVAFKLAWALAKELSDADKVAPQFRTALLDALPLAALGTIADVVSLTGENRIIARHGLARLPTTQHVGLQALLESAGLTGRAIGAYEVGFRLAPRLNAAGRMGHARLAVEMLTRASADRAREIGLYLEEHNRNRQATERRITKQACESIESAGLAGDGRRGIVLAAEGWHAGVIGIVASRLVDRYRRPTVLIAINNGQGQGSARSVPHFHMHQALAACAQHLITFGGHAMAAGLKIDSQKIDAFTEAFIEQANNTLTGRDLEPALRVDAQVEFPELNLRTIQTLETLGPFGQGNPKPRLCTDWIELAGEPRTVGKSGEHLTAAFRQNGTTLRSIAFGQADVAEDLKLHRRCKVAFEPIINRYQGRQSVEMQVLDYRFPD